MRTFFLLCLGLYGAAFNAFVLVPLCVKYEVPFFKNMQAQHDIQRKQTYIAMLLLGGILCNITMAILVSTLVYRAIVSGHIFKYLRYLETKAQPYDEYDQDAQWHVCVDTHGRHSWVSVNTMELFPEMFRRVDSVPPKSDGSECWMADHYYQEISQRTI